MVRMLDSGYGGWKLTISNDDRAGTRYALNAVDEDTWLFCIFTFARGRSGLKASLNSVACVFEVREEIFERTIVDVNLFMY